MLELLFLLLPIAAAYGWYMGRRSIRQGQQQKAQAMSRDYFTGLNYLLSNDADKAVDLFINLLEVDDETIDTHMALGALFRRRGEVERSIRIHQNLIARPSLTVEQRDLAMLELGKDYHAAGFYDRAEEIFVNLISQSEHVDEAETQLLDIYQITKDWQKAIDVVARFNRSTRKRYKPLLAHFYCQLAEEETEPKVKLAKLKSAVKQDAKCGRAWLQKAELELEQGSYTDCQQSLEQLLQADVNLFSEALPVVKECFERLNNPQGHTQMLQTAVGKEAGASVVLALAQRVLEEESQADAERLILQHLMQHPTLKGFHRLMKFHLAQAEDGKAKDSLSMLEKLVQQQIRVRPGYRCHECGFPGHSLHWQCPSCKQWGSMKPVIGLDGE
ncbi:lipopolysaccharide assembly protein LapB [Paraferrimonas sedimenticola]|uniref:Lipopolysaccharide assembly protein B n=1 Tax=Paraferrimonas sedimenticola TaxID=375674 RepID=A0AA37RXA7_9GAMM|nr:lipopolysaccharide assembly protein LapB [Paraferrimonas sedimenticola]GLP96614.1 lipopolysaccharide assembly protein B [Paraferrimonas sedimenticola]